MTKEFDFKETCEVFIAEKEIMTYNKCIRNFEEYLTKEKITNSDNIKIYFQGITADVLIKSLEFYIDENNITSYGAVNTYTSCIKEYFRFLIKENYLENEKISSEFGYAPDDIKSYSYKITDFLSTKPEIVLSEGFDTLEDIKGLISYCDLTMENEAFLSKASDSQIYFNKYRSALFIKLMLLTGAVYRSLIKCKKSDVDLKHCSITLNNLTIRLPNKIVDQMEHYLDLRSIRLTEKKTDTEYLFIEFDTSPMSSVTTTTSGYLNKSISRGDISSVSKYAIIGMIKKGINKSIIIKFTGVGEDIYHACQEVVSETLDLESSSYLDSKIRSTEIFNLL